jgi:hypothetical protein
MGPVGSSKSSACCMEIFSRACAQKAHNGLRKSRWAILRNTYPELKSTTIKTWQQWFPSQVAPIKWDAPISSHIATPLPDGTRVEAEILFIPLDRPEDVDKLRSLELTGAWMNEASEMAKAVLDMLTQRVGRYPPIKEGGPSWYGVMMDTNPPDDDHWYYRLAEKEKPESWEFFKQPGGLVEKNGEYEPNPLAENIPNLPGGHGYYIQQIPGKAKEWIKVFLLGTYGTVADGRPVYPEYSDEIHCREVLSYPGLPLLLGFDYGLTPACAICQLSPRGQLIVLGELFAQGMGIRQFARDIVRPHLQNHYPEYAFQACGDPAGIARKDTDEKTCFMELAEQGIPCVPAISNSFIARREAVAKYLTKLVDGKAGLIVSPGCDMTRRGFNGRYHYKRIQVSGTERYKDVPDKDDYSHIHDALQYAALYSQTMNNSKEWSEPIKYPEAGIV